MGTSVVAALAHAASLASRLKEISKNIENAEFSNALADLGLELARVKFELSSLLDENTQLKEAIRTLKRAQSSTSAASPDPSQVPLVFQEFAYFTPEGDGPFCPGCFDSSGKRIRLSKAHPPFTAFGTHACPSCKEPFGAGEI